MDFSVMKKDQLVAYLKVRDFPTSGMRKPELVALCERVYRLDLPVIIEEDDTAKALCKFLTITTGNLKILVPKTLKPELNHLPMMEMDGDYELELDADGNPKLKESSKWYHQIQGQLFVCKKNFCDFVLFSKKEIFIQRIYADDDWINSVIPKILRFYDDFVFPQLLP
jgi:hypothetical protein